MPNSKDFPINPELDLVLERVIPRHLVWKAWTTPELMKKWFAPLPWTTVDASITLKPGGNFHTVMRSPEEKDFPNEGCILEVAENEKLVWTSGLVKDYRPIETTFLMTAVLIFEDHPKGTKYTAIAMHKSAADRKQHADMGFEPGWSKCADQLVELMKKHQ